MNDEPTYSPLARGSQIPEILLEDKAGEKHRIAAGSNLPALLFFYPKDNTPGCTLEARGFSELRERYERAGYKVFGISGGTNRTKANFCKKHDISVTLLSDPEFTVAKAFGVFGPKTFMGKRYLAVHRVSFVVDAAGVIRHVFENVRPETHPAEALRELGT